MSFHIRVVWCVELDDVPLSVFSCVSVRGCSGSHYSLSISTSIPWINVFRNNILQYISNVYIYIQRHNMDKQYTKNGV